MNKIKYEDFVKIMKDNDGFETKNKLETHNEYYTLSVLDDKRGLISICYEHPEVSVAQQDVEFNYFNTFNFLEKWHKEGNTGVLVDGDKEQPVNLEYLAHRLAHSVRPGEIV